MGERWRLPWPVAPPKRGKNRNRKSEGASCERKAGEAQAPRRQATLGFAAGREFRIGFADHAVAAVALGRVEAAVGARDQRLHGVAVARGRQPTEIVTRPRFWPVERFINSFDITARRM